MFLPLFLRSETLAQWTWPCCAPLATVCHAAGTQTHWPHRARGCCNDLHNTLPHLEVCQHELECLGPLAVFVQHRQLDGVVANLYQSSMPPQQQNRYKHSQSPTAPQQERAACIYATVSTLTAQHHTPHCGCGGRLPKPAIDTHLSLPHTSQECCCYDTQ